ncbi:MAG: hypothetical protein Q8K70_12000 [Bacteroidota bacterium]|nr:hypothetical protein [Bacteroidota bacterium]
MLSHKFFLINVLIFSFLHACKPKELSKVFLSDSSKDYFSIQNNSNYTYTSFNDTNIQVNFKVSNFYTTFSNPDITNNEFITYDLTSNEFPIKFTFKIESGPTQFKDRITLISKKNDSLFIGPSLFNLNGNFDLSKNSKDSLSILPAKKFNNTTYDDVIRIKLFEHPMFNEIYYAKFKGLIAFSDKKGIIYYAIKTEIIN